MKLPEENPWTRVVEDFNVGDIIEVTILRLTPYGAFVSVVPGADGLIHISQIAHTRVNNINDALTVGQKVNVKIMEIDTENKKIALSIKETLEAPEEAEEVAEEEPVAETTEE
jgi:ribosomal protein S1